MSPELRPQHGPAIAPADADVVAGVTARLSLLASAGESFTTPDQWQATWARAFARRAVVWNGPARRGRGAERNGCFAVTLALVASDPERYRYVFGWALDTGDLHWRTHAWALDTRTGRIVEPTPSPRVAYIGVELSHDEVRAGVTGLPG